MSRFVPIEDPQAQLDTRCPRCDYEQHHEFDYEPGADVEFSWDCEGCGVPMTFRYTPAASLSRDKTQ